MMGKTDGQQQEQSFKCSSDLFSYIQEKDQASYPVAGVRD